MTAPEQLRRAAVLLEQGQGGEARELLGSVLADLSRPAPVPPAVPGGFREALEQFRDALADVSRRAAPGGFSFWRSALWRLRELAALLSLYPDPRDAGKMLELAGGGDLLPEQSAELLPLAERVAALCPAEPLGLSAEAEAVRVKLLGQLGDLEADAEAGKVWAFHAGVLRRYGPRFRELLEGLPASAYPHGDAARVVRAARSVSNGGGFHAAWPLEEGAARLAALTAPEPPHAPQVVRVPAVRVLLEPDPPLAWEGRAEVRGTWYGGPGWSRDRTPSEAEPLEGLGWEVRQGPGGEVPELLPVRFPLALRRSDLPSWRGWVPASAEGEKVPPA